MKKIIFNGIITLILISCATIIPDNETGNYFQTYRISNNECAIVAYLGNNSNVIIPGIINGKTVTEISDGVFQGKNLTSVRIPDSVTHIGKDAFKNNRLTSVIIPDSITSIEQDSFRNNRLTSVIIPNSVTKIGVNAFRDNRLAVIRIGNKVNNIGSFAFYNNRLSEITIPGSVRIIDSNAFAGNPLEQINIDSGSASDEFKVLLRNEVSVVIPGNIILITVNSLGNFSKAYAANNRRPGTYTIKEDEILFNGTAIPKPAAVTTGENTWLVKINGQSPVLYCFDFSRNRSVSNWQSRDSLESLALKKFPYKSDIKDFHQGTFYLPPGEHTIEVIYFAGQKFSSIIRVLDKQMFTSESTNRITARLSSDGRRVIYNVQNNYN